MTSGGYYQLIAEARSRLDDGQDLEAVLALLRSRGMESMSCIGAVRNLLGVELHEAKRIVLDSSAFADLRAGHDAFWDAVAKAENEVPDGAQDQSDSRAGAENRVRAVTRHVRTRE